MLITFWWGPSKVDVKFSGDIHAVRQALASLTRTGKYALVEGAATSGNTMDEKKHHILEDNYDE